MRRSMRYVRTLVVALVSVACVAASPGLGPSAQAASAPAAGDPALPFYGTWSDGLSMERTFNQKELTRQADNGVGLVRQYIWWDRMETSPGVYNWGRMDQLVTDASKGGVQILPTLLYPPEFYNSEPEGYSGAPYPPDDPQTMARFATKMVERYGTNGRFWCDPPRLPGLPPPPCREPYAPITHWEVWNEPDYKSWWKGQQSPDPAEYLELLKAVSIAIKAADPAAKIVLGSMTNTGGGTRGGYLDRLYGLGAKDYFDVLSLNPYARDVGAMVAYIRGQRAIAVRHGDAAKPVIVTEYGWASEGVHPYIVAPTPQCQGALLYAATTRLWALREELHILAAVQFQWHDVGPAGTTPWPNRTGVIGVDDQPKPSMAAYKAAANQQPAPAGMTLAEACPADRQSLDGTLQPLTVTKSGPGTGLVKGSSYRDGVDCGGDCFEELAPGTVVTLRATPDAGFSVVDWKGAACSGLECTFRMDSPTDVEVVFAPVAAPGRYEQDHSLVSRTGRWLRSPAVKDSAGASAFATAGPATASLIFEGTGVRWLSRTARTNGISRVFIDGRRVARVDGYSQVTRHRVTLFNSADLPTDQHRIRIEFTGDKRAAATNNNTVLDAFVVR